MEIPSGNVQDLRFTALFSGVNERSTTNDDKSLRLHGGLQSGNDLQLKVHTKTSRIGQGGDRALKRQEALTLVKQSLVNQFNGDQQLANTIFSKVTLAKNDRISLGELKDLKQAVDAEQAKRKDVRTILEQMISGQPDAKTMKDCLDRLNGAYLDGNGARSDAMAMNLPGNLDLQRLLRDALKGSDTELKTALDRVSSVMDMKSNALPGIQGDATRAKTAQSLKVALNHVLRDVRLKLAGEQFNRANGTDVTQKKQQWTALTNNTQAIIPSQQQKTNFQSKGMPELLQNQSWSVATGGTTGSIFVGDKNSTDRAILKIDSQSNTKATSEISNYILSVTSQLPPNQVRYETMMVKELDVVKDTPSLTVKLKEMNTDPNSNKRTKDVSGDHLNNINDPLFAQYQGLGKLSMIPNATDVNRLPVNDRVALCKTSTFPQDLGRCMVAGRLFGLNDHVCFSPDTPGGNPTFKGGNNNISNLMMNKDTGKLVLIDFMHVDGGRINNGSGYSSNEVLKAFDECTNFMKQNFLGGNVEAGLSEVLRPFAKSPLTDFVKIMFNTSTPNSDGAFTSLFTEAELGGAGALDKQARMNFVANVFLGVIAEFKSIQANQQAYLSGQPTFDNPQQVLQHTGGLAGQLTQVEQALTNYIATH